MDEFQQKAIATLAITEKSVLALSHRTLGLIGESGIVANQAKKIIRDNNTQASDEDIAIIQKRLGDVLYYCAEIADYFDLSLDQIAKQNAAQSDEFKKERQQKS